MTNLVAHFFWIHVQTLGDQASIGGQIAGRIAQEHRGVRGVVVDNGPPVTIENLPTRGEYGNVADAVSLGSGGVVVTL